MTRPLRLEFAGALYHVTSRGDGRDDIYLNDADNKQFLNVLSEVCQRFNWTIHAFCLMDNHYHLLIETPDSNLAKGMRHLNGVYTQRFNRTHQRVGHVFQGRYKAILVHKESCLLELARYIVLNPVRAQMVRSVKDWPWSSYRATAGQSQPHDWLNTEWLLSAFAKTKGVATKRYRAFVAEGKNQPSIWKQLKHQIYLGSEAFVEQMQQKMEFDKDLSEIPSAHKRPLAKTLEYYDNQYPNRNSSIIKAYASGGYSMKEIGDYYNLHYSRVSRIVKSTVKAKGKT
ncbi:MAG: transposase [Gammaproteobacteria bacterium]|nr:MAG: transposase [Gammaproteobacteria bacterium]